MFATIFFGDPRSGDGRADLGQRRPRAAGRAAPSGALERLAPTGPAVGLMPGSSFEARATTLAPGDVLLVLTDGVTDERGPSGAFYGEDPLLAIVAEPSGGARALLSRIEQSVGSHRGSTERSDDLTMLAVRRGSARWKGRRERRPGGAAADSRGRFSRADSFRSRRGSDAAGRRPRLEPAAEDSARGTVYFVRGARQPTTDPATEGKPPAVGNAVRRTAITQTPGRRQRRAKPTTRGRPTAVGNAGLRPAFTKRGVNLRERSGGRLAPRERAEARARTRPAAPG